jgi:hypothetical protein
MCEEILHLPLISRKDEDHLSPEILDLSKQEIQDLDTAVILSGGELVGFVDEYCASATVDKTIDKLFAFRYPIGCETRSGRFDEGIPRKDSDGCQEFGVESSDCRLACGILFVSKRNMEDNNTLN